MRHGTAQFFSLTTPIFDKNMGRRLGNARVKMKLKQAELGKLLGVSQSVISRLEAGQMKHGDFNTGQLKTVLGIHFQYFLTGAGKENYEKYHQVKYDPFGNMYF